MVKQSANKHDEVAMRKWARELLTGLKDALNGIRNDQTRAVIGTYVERIIVWPSKRCG